MARTVVRGVWAGLLASPWTLSWVLLAGSGPWLLLRLTPFGAPEGPEGSPWGSLVRWSLLAGMLGVGAGLVRLSQLDPLWPGLSRRGRRWGSWAALGTLAVASQVPWLVSGGVASRALGLGGPDPERLLRLGLATLQGSLLGACVYLLARRAVDRVLSFGLVVALLPALLPRSGWGTAFCRPLVDVGATMSYPSWIPAVAAGIGLGLLWLALPSRTPA